MPARTYLLRRDDDELVVDFRQEPWISTEVRCMVPGCTWTHPDWDETAMQGHARDEWSGAWKHERPPLTGYAGPHTAGGDCPCKPTLSVTWTHDVNQMTVQRCHNGPTELVVGREAAAARAQFGRNPLHPQWQVVDHG